MADLPVEPLDAGRPEWGTVYVVPWDTEIFGFPVGTYTPGDPAAIERDVRDVSERLAAWAAARDVELVSCTVAADDRGWRAVLPELAFTVVEQTVRIRLRLQAFSAPPPTTPVRLAGPDDVDQIEEIAGHAFRHGRYHADPRFSPELADRRYRYWVRSTLRSNDPLDRVYVLGHPGTVKGFFQLRLNENRADVGIIAVRKALQGSPAGPDLVIGTQLALKADGVRWIVSKVSAANLGLLNLVTHLGYRLRTAEATFHWHAPNAPHLLPRGGVLR
jgi:hypothetical protein